mgnify:CR=1 FL=1
MVGRGDAGRHSEAIARTDNDTDTDDDNHGDDDRRRQPTERGPP